MKKRILDFFTIEKPIDLNNYVVGGRPYQRERMIRWSSVGGILALIIIALILIY